MASEGGGIALCVNGHRMLAVAAACPVCGGPRGEYSYEPPTGIRVAEREVPRGPGSLVTAVGGALLALGMAVVVLLAAARAPGGDLGASGENPGANVGGACGGIADVELQLGDVVADAPETSCVDLRQQAALTVWARSNDPTMGVKLQVDTEQGAAWANDVSEAGEPATVDSLFAPGVYVITVTGVDGGPPPEFTLSIEAYSSSDPSASAGPGDGLNSNLPAESECGASIPLIDSSGEVETDADPALVCLTVRSGVFEKFGVESLTPAGLTPPDLTLTLYKYDAEGKARFAGAFDDAFDTDPEVNTDLEGGTYLLAAGTWTGEPVGSVRIYADSTGTYFRRGAVSVVNSWATAATCAAEGAPFVQVGGSIDLAGGAANYACLTLPAAQTLRIAGTSPSRQDLAFEVIEVSGDTPARMAWADDDLLSDDPSAIDPIIDVRLPAGTYVIAFLEVDLHPVTGATLTVSAR